MAPPLLPADLVPGAPYDADVDRLTADLWAKQDQHVGDRHRLFAAIASAVDASPVLYPGSFVDVAPSFVFPSVTYVDTDRRAARFFADRVGVQEIIAAHRTDGALPEVVFVPGDYSALTGLVDRPFDLLVSLYAGFVRRTQST